MTNRTLSSLTQDTYSSLFCWSAFAMHGTIEKAISEKENGKKFNITLQNTVWSDNALWLYNECVRLHLLLSNLHTSPLDYIQKIYLISTHSFGPKNEQQNYFNTVLKGYEKKSIYHTIEKSSTYYYRKWRAGVLILIILIWVYILSSRT